MTKFYPLLFLIAGCDIGPRVTDVDAIPPPNAGKVLPAGSVVPGVATNPELINQIRINDGLADMTLMTNNNVVVRGTGKSAGVTVRFWNFGPSPVDGFAVVAPIYIFGRLDDTGAFTPLPNHLPMLDTIPGDVRYSPIRRVVNVPVTSAYKGELITSLAALGDAVELGLVGDPIAEGTWMNMPVVLPGVMLEVGTVPPIQAKQVYARGYIVDAFELGTSLGRQPFRNGFMPIGQASSLQSGVATGVPPTLPVGVDPQPVFQFAIPTAPPGMTFTYTPLTSEIIVRLATGIAPADILSDADMFKRSAAGAITAFVIDKVASFTATPVTTSVNNLQLQFTEGSP